jgi:hypothetical protein
MDGLWLGLVVLVGLLLMVGSRVGTGSTRIVSAVLDLSHCFSFAVFLVIRPLLFDQHEPHFFLRGCSSCLSVNFVVLVSTRFRHDL